MYRELFKTWIAGFGQVFLIGLQTYNLVELNYWMAALTSLLITVCWIQGVHAVLKTRLHKVCYGLGAVMGVEMAMVMHSLIVRGT